MFILLKNANVYAPQHLGKVNILVGCGKIISFEPDLKVQGIDNISIIDCQGRTVTPGLIDQHVHLVGGGGEGGFSSRTPQVTFSKLIKQGQRRLLEYWELMVFLVHLVICTRKLLHLLMKDLQLTCIQGRMKFLRKR